MTIFESAFSKTLLLVDDKPDHLQVLKEILQNDYQLLFAQDGRTALDVSTEKQPDLILLNVMLPEMNGYEVCKALKQDTRTAGILVIFISNISDSNDEIEGFAAGGVDYLRRPLSPAIIKARVATHLSLVQKLKEMHRADTKLREINSELKSYRNNSEYELDMARELMEHMIKKSSAPVTDVELWLHPTTNLSGDLVITQHYYNERSYVLLADAMGHGLPAALPLMPIVQVFSSMARDGFTVPAIVREMNNRIIDLIPTGNFVAVTLLSIDHVNRSIEIWNGGNPPALHINASEKVSRKFTSRHPALGIFREGEFSSATELFHWHEDCSITLYSDGLTDAQNIHGEAFGEGRTLLFLSAGKPHQSLKEAVLEHLDGQDAHDDISIATIHLHGQ